MPLDEEPSELARGLTVQGDEWDGPWGSISPVPGSIETLCFQIESEVGKPRIYYYPYRTIGKWNWKMDDPEVLEIQVGGIQIAISGMGLRRLAEALNLGQLRKVQLSPVIELATEIRVRSVVFQTLKASD
jgi:hypothetical protein